MTNRALRIGLRILLVVSLAINLAVLAFGLRLLELRDLAGLRDTRLPPEIRAAVRQAASEDPELLAALRAMGPPRRAVLAAGAARPFDPAALEAAMADVRTATTTAQTEAQRIILEAYIRQAAGDD